MYPRVSGVSSWSFVTLATLFRIHVCAVAAAYSIFRGDDGSDDGNDGPTYDSAVGNHRHNTKMRDAFVVVVAVDESFWPAIGLVIQIDVAAAAAAAAARWYRRQRNTRSEELRLTNQNCWIEGHMNRHRIAGWKTERLHSIE